MHDSALTYEHLLYRHILASLIFNECYSQTLRFLRAVSYRCLAPWLFGHLGMKNTQPLPACVYHNMRKRILIINETNGFVSGQECAGQES